MPNAFCPVRKSRPYMPYVPEQVDQFFSLYVKNLEKAILKYPADYGFDPAGARKQAEATTSKIRDVVVVKGLGHVNINSKAFVWTTKELKIPNTYKGIEAFLNKAPGSSTESILRIATLTDALLTREGLSKAGMMPDALQSALAAVPPTGGTIHVRVSTDPVWEFTYKDLALAKKAAESISKDLGVHVDVSAQRNTPPDAVYPGKRHLKLESVSVIVDALLESEDAPGAWDKTTAVAKLLARRLAMRADRIEGWMRQYNVDPSKLYSFLKDASPSNDAALNQFTVAVVKMKPLTF